MTVAELTGDYFEHVTVSGDRWDLLAYRYYGDQNKQAILLEANRSLFLADLSVPPLIIPHGMRLRIPVLVEEPTNIDLLPPWKRDNPTYGA